MRLIRHARQSFYDLSVGDSVEIGALRYVVQQGARGGMGCVILLRRDLSDGNRDFQALGLRLALKAVLPSVLDEESVLLFRRELTVWSGLRHHGVLALLDILDGGDAGWVAAMDWCDGSLRDILRQKNRLSSRDSWRVIAALLDGLEYAYAKDGIHHLDIKPENILYIKDITRVGSKPKDPTECLFEYSFLLSDWGIASVKERVLRSIVSQAQTSPETVAKTFNNIGTMVYMAPERFIQGYSSSATSDIFSLGMLYIEMLTGVLPFSDNSDPIRSLLSGAYLATADSLLKRSDVPKSIRQFILRCVAHDARHRPQNYHTFRAEFLDAYKNSRGLLQRFL